MSRQALILAALWTAPVFGQTASDAGAIRGTIRDETGALVAGAKVSLTEDSKELVRESESDASGSFLFTSVIPGSYALRVEKGGFNKEQLPGLKIEVGEQTALVITLKVGPSRTEITVPPPGASDLQAGSNTLGSVVDFDRVQELPLNGRYFLELSELSAGAGPTSTGSNLFTTNVGPPGRTVILPGTLPYSVNYHLNGINVTGSRDGELALSPSIAAIDQFKVQENFLMPDEGINPALVNIVTRSGSNQFHGEAYEFFRNRVLGARSFFAAHRDDVKLNQFGGAMGGPLRKNKLWFYGFYEGMRELTAFPAVGYSPTAGMFGGNFAATSSVIYDPATYNRVTNSRQPFPDSQVPMNRINPVSRNLMQYYIPGSSLASTPSNVFGSPRNTQTDDQGGGFRLDGAINPQSQLFGQFIHQHSASDQPGLFPFSGLSYLNSSDLAMVQHTWSLSARSVTTLRVGFLRNLALGGNEAKDDGDDGPNARVIGVMNTFATKGVTAINLQGYSSFGRANGQIGNQDNAWQLDEEFTYSRGSHILAFGGGLHYQRGWHLNGNASGLGSLSFQPVFTSQLSQNSQGQTVPLANTGNSFADVLLGFPVTGMLIGLPAVQFRSTQLTPYFQDSWRVTINYGLSWYLETPPEPRGWARQYIRSFDFTTGLLTFAVLGQISYNPVKTDYNNLAPRLGVAWKPEFLNGTILRAAAGLYYSGFPWALGAYSVLGPPAGAGQNLTNAQSTPVPEYALGLNIFSPPSTAPLTATYAASLPPGATVEAVDPNFRTGYISQWDFSIERSFGLSDFELNYLGASGHRLPNVSDPAQCHPTATLLCNPSARPYPRYGLVVYADSSGNSSYEALVAKLDTDWPRESI